jgi:hypothetical protein
VELYSFAELSFGEPGESVRLPIFGMFPSIGAHIRR